LDARIDKHRAVLARLLRQRISANLRRNYPDLVSLWVFEARRLSVVRASALNGRILWDSERRARYGGPEFDPYIFGDGCWSALDDLEVLAAVLPESAPRTKDGYLIVRLPETKDGDDA
jgi:hypothetical protein